MCRTGGVQHDAFGQRQGLSQFQHHIPISIRENSHAPMSQASLKALSTSILRAQQFVPISASERLFAQIDRYSHANNDDDPIINLT